MKVVICEDNLQQQKMIYSILRNYAMINHPSIDIVLVASNAEEVLDFLKVNKADCYFLDIELGQGMNGLQLASEIRKNDILADIIFITDYTETLKLTFKYKIAALDYIIKRVDETFSDEISSVFEIAIQRYINLGRSEKMNFFQIKIGELIKNIHLENIYYFETSDEIHKIRIIEKNGMYEFYGKLKDIEKLGLPFFRSHKSYIVNLHHILQINKKEKYIELINGTKCPISIRAYRSIQSNINLLQKCNIT